MNQNLAELLRGLGSGLADIREKVIEEPMYGRVINDSGQPLNVTSTEVVSPDAAPPTWVERVAEEPAPLDASELRGGIDLER